MWTLNDHVAELGLLWCEQDEVNERMMAVPVLVPVFELELELEFEFETSVAIEV